MLLKRDEVQNPKPEPLQALSSFKRASVVDSALNYSIKEAPPFGVHFQGSLAMR